MGIGKLGALGSGTRVSANVDSVAATFKAGVCTFELGSRLKYASCCASLVAELTGNAPVLLALKRAAKESLSTWKPPSGVCDRYCMTPRELHKKNPAPRTSTPELTAPKLIAWPCLENCSSATATEMPPFRSSVSGP